MQLRISSDSQNWPLLLTAGRGTCSHLFAKLGFDPRDDLVRNQTLSPFYHVDRIRISLQVHQGANDIRVPRAQSDWMVQLMRRMGRTVEYFVYPDEGHGFTHFENERLAYQRLIAFYGAI